MWKKKKSKKSKYGVIKTNNNLDRVSKSDRKATKRPYQSEDACAE